MRSGYGWPRQACVLNSVAHNAAMIRPPVNDFITGQAGCTTVAVVSRLYGYALMGWLVVTRWGRLREPQLRQQLHRQVHLVGISALPVIVALAMLTVAAAVTQVTALAGTGSDAAQIWLFYGLFLNSPLAMCPDFGGPQQCFHGFGAAGDAFAR
jgi:hypothetical protein